MFRNACLVVSLAIAAGPVSGQMVGAPAPQLRGVSWIAGSPSERFERGKVYLIDIWATWCGPCVSGLPHLAEFQTRYAAEGLNVIGLVSKDQYGSNLADAKKIVQDPSHGVNYAIAWDEGRAYKTWMSLESDSGWPWCFVIGRNGKVLYSGHPMFLDSILPKIMDGSYDTDSATEAYKRRMAAKAEVSSLASNYKSQKWQSALGSYDRIWNLDKQVAADYELYKLVILGQKLRDYDRATKFSQRAMARFARNVRALYTIADFWLDPKRPLPKRNLELALSAARAAFAASSNRDLGSLQLVARAHHLMRQDQSAVAAQEKALLLSSPTDRRAVLEVLESYRRALIKKAAG